MKGVVALSVLKKINGQWLIANVIGQAQTDAEKSEGGES